MILITYFIIFKQLKYKIKIIMEPLRPDSMAKGVCCERSHVQVASPLIAHKKKKKS